MIEKRVDKTGVYLYSFNERVVTMDIMLESIKLIEEDLTLPRELRILEDATDSKAAFGIHDVKVIYQKIKRAAQNYTFVKHAVVHNSRINTAYALFVENLTRDAKYQLRVFSSIQAAEKWLLIQDNPNQE